MKAKKGGCLFEAHYRPVKGYANFKRVYIVAMSWQGALEQATALESTKKTLESLEWLDDPVYVLREA